MVTPVSTMAIAPITKTRSGAPSTSNPITTTKELFEHELRPSSSDDGGFDAVEGKAWNLMSVLCKIAESLERRVLGSASMRDETREMLSVSIARPTLHPYSAGYTNGSGFG